MIQSQSIQSKRRPGFVLLGVLVLFAVLASMMVVISKLETNAGKRVQFWRDQSRLENLALSAFEMAKTRLLAKAEAAKGTLDAGEANCEVIWSIEPAAKGVFLIKGYARTPTKGTILLQGEANGRFTRKVEKDEVRLVPVKS